MSKLILKTFDGKKITVTDEQAKNAAKIAGLIAIIDEKTGDTSYVNKSNVASIEPEGSGMRF